MNKNKANNVFQTSIFDGEPGQRPASVKNTPVEKAGKRKDAVKEPATTLCKLFCGVYQKHDISLQQTRVGG